MIDFKLLPTQKNEVFQHVSDAGLDPSQFKWATRDLSFIRYFGGGKDITKKVTAYHSPSLSTRTGDFYFTFYQELNTYYYTCCPGKGTW